MVPKRRVKTTETPGIFAIYPDYWKPQWGPKPLLGFVNAFNAFEASRRAYTKGLLRQNFTFEAEAVPVQRSEMKEAIQNERDRQRRKL